MPIVMTSPGTDVSGMVPTNMICLPLTSMVSEICCPPTAPSGTVHSAWIASSSSSIREPASESVTIAQKCEASGVAQAMTSGEGSMPLSSSRHSSGWKRSGRNSPPLAEADENLPERSIGSLSCVQ